MGGQQIPTGIVQLGKKTADIVFGGYMLPAVISDNRLIFNAPYPGKKDVLLTYTGNFYLIIYCPILRCVLLHCLLFNCGILIGF